MGKDLNAPPLVAELLGTVLEGRYRVDELLAVGGMSFVFRGHHLRLRRDIAIKVMDPDLGPGTSTRFLREAESAARLDHPNCITVHDFGVTASELSFMVMPLLVGETLRARPPGRWDAARAARLMIEVLRGLDHAHGHGVIHRDLKPENILLSEEPDGSRVAKIVDFGLAKVIRGTEADATSTMTGLMAGTPAYMSPEQALGLSVDERADLYSVGMMLYELLAGALPFDSDDGVAVLRMQVHEDLPALPAEVPAALAAIVMHLTAKERDQRPASAHAALADLEAFLRGDGHTILAPAAAVRRPTPEHLAAASSDGATPISGSGSRRAEVTLFDREDEPARRSGRGWLWLAATLATASAATVVAITWSQPQLAVAAPPDDPELAAAPPPSATAPPSRVAAPSIPELLAIVNDRELSASAGWTHRHELLEALARAGASEQADLHLQVSLDLLQASDSGTPCRSFAAALDTITIAGASAYVDALRDARAPQNAADPACADLPARLERLRGGTLVADAADDATVVTIVEPSVPAKHKGKPKHGARKLASAKPEPRAAQPESRATTASPAAQASTKPARKHTIPKLDDDLRPPA
jgi:serine/threonine protein kinase